MQQDHIQSCLPLNPTHRFRVCVRTEYDALCSNPFNLICNMTTFRKNALNPPQRPSVCVCVKVQNMHLHVAAILIPFNMICNMTMHVPKKFILTV